MYCGETTIVKRHEGSLTAVSLRCRAWTCELCAEGRKKQLMAEGCGGKPNTFLTLTSRRVQGASAQQAAKALSRAWRLLRLRIMRRYDLKALPFLCVFEQTKTGWPHLHIMARMQFVPVHWISEVMDELTDSPIVYIKRIDDLGRMVAYVTKYCSKDCHKFGTCKRYWQSRDFDVRIADPEKAKPAPGAGWEREDCNLVQWCTRWRAFGYSVQMLNGWRAVARPPDSGG